MMKFETNGRKTTAGCEFFFITGHVKSNSLINESKNHAIRKLVL